MMKKIWLFLLMFTGIFSYSLALAEVRVFEKEVVEAVGQNQRREQMEAFAVRKAKRLVMEEAGRHLLSMTIVQNYQIKQDDAAAIASGVVQAKIVGSPYVQVENGVLLVKVKARADMDTDILDHQIQEIMADKETLKKLDADWRKDKEIEETLLKLKRSEAKMLGKLNAQALVLDQEREQRRLSREERAVRARDESLRIEADRIAKERQLQAQTRIVQTLADQEKARQEEAVALAVEKDRIKRALLENEHRWNDLARRAKLTQDSWITLDDDLTLKEAMEEAKNLKAEIADLTKRLDIQDNENVANIENVYTLEIAQIKPDLPPAPDDAEKTETRDQRMKDYQARADAANKDYEAAVEKLRADRNLKLAEAGVAYPEQSVKILEPFILRLQRLQARKFALPEGAMTVVLGIQDTDKSRFPMTLTYKGENWPAAWACSDPNRAMDFARTQTDLKAKALFQLEEGKEVSYRLTAAHVTHAGMKESRELELAKPVIFAEIGAFEAMRTQAAAAANKLKKLVKDMERAAKLRAFGITSEIIKDPVTGIESLFIEGGCYRMGDTFGGGDPGEQPVHEVCVRHFFMGKYEVTQGQWKQVMGSNPASFKDCGDDCPVEKVSWDDVQDFIRRLNSQSGMHYRLPTEAEWEYATRSGGKNEKWAGTSDEASLGDYAWIAGNSGGKTHAVGQKKPNGLGLYDMSGNVYEWCNDWFVRNYYVQSPKDNPTGPFTGTSRVERGGAWSFDAWFARASYRVRNVPGLRSDSLGFRLALPIRQ
ncbi:MAG: SUMF1/EgtB/PvdO family nonheme iron enzyme [Deltaproteobacteria bacterium]|nr:SUMF1/EgtB/PvdO family nonheme iron enzyme [Deltaproteobacteria bacterium]